MDHLKIMDAFSTQFGVTFDGKTKHKTIIGGICTILIMILVILYAIVMILEPLKVKSSIQSVVESEFGYGLDSSTLIQGTNRAAGTALSETTIINGVEFQGVYDVKKYTSHIDYTSSNAERFMPFREGFHVAVEYPVLMDHKSIEISFWYESKVNDVPSHEAVGSQPCNISDFPTELHDELRQANIENMVCPSRDDLEFFGNRNGYDYGNLLIEVIRCDGKDYCLTNSEIEQLMVLSLQVKFLYIDQEFDYNDLDNPIRYRVNYEGFIELVPSLIFHKYYYLSPNRVIINDTVTRFYNVEFESSRDNVNDGVGIGYVVILPTTKYDVYIPYIDYQPIVNSNRRNLASDNEEEIMSIHYFVLYFISQIGGFSAFFLLLIGSIIKYINERY